MINRMSISRFITTLCAAVSIVRLEKFDIPLFGWKKGANFVPDSRQNTRKKEFSLFPCPSPTFTQINLDNILTKGLYGRIEKEFSDIASASNILPLYPSNAIISSAAVFLMAGFWKQFDNSLDKFSTRHLP